MRSREGWWEEMKERERGEEGWGGKRRERGGRKGGRDFDRAEMKDKLTFAKISAVSFNS